jgi:energy-coupling factor transporter transmembrane protein EcfT
MAKKQKSFIHKVDWRIASVAILAICILGGLAIWKAIDGVMFSAALIAIAGIAGFELRKFIK